MAATTDVDQLDWRRIANRLVGIGLSIREHLAAHRDRQHDADVVGFEGGDTIFAIDKRVEPILIRHFEDWSRELGSVVLVAEGLGPEGTMRFGGGPPRLRVLVDPIDGTRCLMLDKRSAWFIAAAAPDLGASTRLSMTCASAIVELPTTRQRFADTFVHCHGRAIGASRVDMVANVETALSIRPSSASTLINGFGQVVSFFPGTKVLAAELMERIALSFAASGEAPAAIFDDQYASSGGQFVELLMGRDRFCCDLRPVFHRILERRAGAPLAPGLACHPYDIGAAELVRTGGVILTDAFGAPLDAHFSVHEPVSWCGYANLQLQKRIEPIIQNWIREHLPH